ncbi:YncE family protein [Halorubrum sp. DTA98]|uniref:YncE family protein n=1 Tax=Halorubrum sp. DTA98 TaxID=3402163 RepID=UPI003AAF90E7
MTDGDNAAPSTGTTDASGRIVAVPCEGADVLALLALETGERLGEIPVGSHPVHATTCRGRTFVATMGERAVTAVGPDGEVRQIDTGVLGPSHFAVAGGTLFTACSAGDAVAVIDPETLTLVGRVAVGAEPHELAASPDGDRLYVGSRRDGTVDVVDVAARERVDAVDVGPDARVQGVALSPDGTRGYAIDQRGARAVAFDASVMGATSDTSDTSSRRVADRLLETAAVGADPYDLVVTADRVFVPGRADGTVHEFDEDLVLRDIHERFSRPVDLFRIDGAWWVLDADEAAIRSLDGEVVETAAPGLVARAVDGRLVVSHYDDDCVSLVDVGEGTVWTTEVPSYPFGAVVV